MKNTLVCELPDEILLVRKIKKKNRPFSGDFEQIECKFHDFNTITAKVVMVGGREPGRIYAGTWDDSGTLLECYSIN